ncbi:unnamed protein product [Tilletia caries]|uniref:Uncharacterized protein n=1 Tax=Tilletia caries TaxID=13290 RepID=A0A8T8T861_9BASI|nr:hypothetical protein CF328_g5410 [Tilletia controversa]KAE8256791.1 hypothetical protein A4X03_0g5051 [Tilletia caries]CAD6883988.1 unnamed protein product [Tilletia caries]CAD6901596.1 unnamed protein product [Tilletia caries]CAD6929137.1 unnamed protein product [Tilletia caries]
MATPSFKIRLRLPPKEDGLDGGTVPTGSGEDVMSYASSQSGSDGGNEDELDELVDEVDEHDQASNMSGTPVRKRPSSSKKRVVKAETAMDTPSPGGSSPAMGKKRLVTTREETQDMSLAELDDLPAAKRRRAHQARGSSGPGRGWRKGLKMGQKAVYQVHPEPDRSAIPKSSSTLTKGKAAPGSATKTTPAVPAAPKGRPFKYPVITPFRTVPVIKPIARIPQVIPAIIPLDRTGDAAKKAPRRWTQRKREILSISGRPWSIPLWFGGPDQDYHPVAAERKSAASAAAGGSSDSKANLSLQLGTADGRSTPGGTPVPSTPSALQQTTRVFFGLTGANGGGSSTAGTSADAPVSAQKRKETPTTRGGISGSGSRAKRPSVGVTRSRGGGGGVSAAAIPGGVAAQRSGSASAKSSPLTHTIPLPGTTSAQPVGDWRGSSPAFFAGARKAL